MAATAAKTAQSRAIITVAHAILVVIWHVLATGTPYDDLGADCFDRRTKPRPRSQRLIARLEALGRRGDSMITEEKRAYRRFFFRDHETRWALCGRGWHSGVIKFD